MLKVILSDAKFKLSSENNGRAVDLVIRTVTSPWPPPPHSNPCVGNPIHYCTFLLANKNGCRERSRGSPTSSVTFRHMSVSYCGGINVAC